MIDSHIVSRRPQRTTVAADPESLETLRAEAHRRGVALTVVLSEAVDEKAAAVRVSRRPRVGIGRSNDGRSAADVTEEPIAHPPS